MEKREYTKKELAIICNPGLDYPSAAQKFRRDVYGCRPLMKILRRRGWKKHKRYLSYWQVCLILEYVYPDVISPL